MNRKFEKLRALSWSERRTLIAAALFLPLFWVALRVLGLSRFQAWLSRFTTTPRGLPSVDTPTTIGALVTTAGNNLPFRTSCLTRSLLLNWLLHRRGLSSEMRIGVRLNDGRLDAHAWVECDGKPVNDARNVSEHYAAFHGALSPASFSSQ